MLFMWRDGVKGLWVGALIGGLAGLGVCVWLIDGTLLFPGDTMVFGAVGGGVLGFLIGDAFFEWLAERWHWFIG